MFESAEDFQAILDKRTSSRASAAGARQERMA